MRVSVFKRTSEDWYPSYSLKEFNKGVLGQKLVEVIFTTTGPQPPFNGVWRVCAWGGDDFGMERDFNKENDAWCCFLKVIGWEDVTQTALFAEGFRMA